MSFTSGTAPVKGGGNPPSDPGRLQDLAVEARYHMLRADESLKQALAASVAIGHQVRNGTLTAANFEEGEAEARVYAALASRYFDHAEFTEANWRTVNELHIRAVTDWLIWFTDSVQPGTATWRLKKRLRANPLARWAALHLRDHLGDHPCTTIR